MALPPVIDKQSYTIVTAVFDLALREPTLGRRDISFYHQHGRELLAQPLDLVIYYDPHLEGSLRALPRPERYKTTYIPLALEETHYYRTAIEQIKANRAA